MTVPAQWAQPAVHPSYARLLCMLMRRRGVELSRLLAGTGLTWAQLVDASRALSFLQMRRLILSALELSGSPLLGLEIGASLPVSAHGQVGYAAMASKDVAQALDVIVRFSALRANLLDMRLVTGEQVSSVQIRERFDLGDVRIPILEATSVLLVQVLEALVGDALGQLEYRVPYPAAPWHAAYAARFAGTIVFDAACMEIRFPSALLAAPCLTADPLAYAAARRDCEQALAQLGPGGDLVQQVRARLAAREGDYPGCDAMAHELHMSARTLMRKLKQRGTSYQALLDEVRQERAQWFLQHTGLPVETIAERLGYLDTSNFGRTFRRWFGVSPKEFRVAAQASPRSGNPQD
ncbi:AraC family transcriptional regulator [Noviherbaspirillum autotrophicum]|uniref:AraC family transcriptional regulator n=1 Tax=Noviherbaspirillum autotrophicum TaxID=709839 RepID=UPI0012FD4D97|nr:AraC family transcriptional regulator [Noviherbaspirillum autotrophicum]